MNDFAYVKCANCGELIEVPWELLGDTRPEDVTDYLCGECDPDNYDGYDDDDDFRIDDDEDGYEPPETYGDL